MDERIFSTSLINLLLRGTSLLSKFLLFIFVGKYFSTTDLGIFSLFVTTITFAIYLIGFDFYTYNCRELLSTHARQRLPFIREQFIFHLISYAFVLPVLIIIFTKSVIPMKYIVWFYLILIAEHISLEFTRLYITLSKPILANFILFLRAGLWVYVLLVFWISGVESFKTINSLWVAWLSSVALSVLISIIYLRKIKLGTIKDIPVDWKWIKSGIKVSVPFLIGTLSIKIMELSDRYMIDYWNTKADVGIYSFFSNIANGITMLVATLVIMVYHPKLVESYTKSDLIKFKHTMNRFIKLIIATSIVSGIFILSIVYPIMGFIKKPEFMVNIRVLYILILSNVVLNISFIPHYFLYVQKIDHVIMYAAIGGAFLNVLINLVLIPKVGMIGAAISSVVSFCGIALFKLYFSNSKSVLKSI